MKEIEQAAINLSVLLNCLRITESSFQHKFSFVINSLYDGPIYERQDILDKLSLKTGLVMNEYEKAKRAFRLLKPTDEIIDKYDQYYPDELKDVDFAPLFLYLRGNKSLLLNKRKVALIGSRMASESSKDKTRFMARKLGRNGIIIVSGLAKGIDAAAHQETLKNNFHTIAVLGTPLNMCYPAENKNLQNEIGEKGLLLSQFSPACPVHRFNFPIRDGLMSAISLASIIMEAGETSGALIQADYAIKQHKLVLIPKALVQSNVLKWPQKYIAKGAKQIDDEEHALRVLAENNIYQNKEENFVEEDPINVQTYFKVKRFNY